MKDIAAAIGIDLGTTFSCVGCYKNGKVEIFENQELGNKITPSYVSYHKNQILVGEAAKRVSVENTSNTIYDMKRLIGKNCMDDTVEKNKQFWTFEVKGDHEDRPVVEVEHQNTKIQVKPEKISSLVLKKMKEIAEKKLKARVTKAVITVPAYFSQAQKQATIQAAEMAELEVVELISEPAAAAFAYGFNEKEYSNLNILVEDIGGGTFDVVVVKVKNGRFVVSAIGGDTQLGGRDFDNMLLEHFAKVIKQKYKKDFFDNKRQRRRVLNECIELKHTLSGADEASFYLGEIFPEIDESIDMKRAEFNKLCDPLFQKIEQITLDTVKDAGLKPSDINEVLLIGGSSRIPRIREILEKMFTVKKLNDKIHPDEAVAYGAALCAAKNFETDCKEIDETIQKIELVEAIPLSLGVEITGGRFSTVIPRNSNVPTKVTKSFVTALNDQKSVSLNVYEGVRPLIKYCNHLGCFVFSGLQPGVAGSQTIYETFELDKNGILSITIKYNGREEHHKIDFKETRTPTIDLAKMMEELKIFEQTDNVEEERLSAREKLRTDIEKLKYKVEHDYMSNDQRIQYQKLADDATKWLDANSDASKVAFEKKSNELINFI